MVQVTLEFEPRNAADHASSRPSGMTTPPTSELSALPLARRHLLRPFADTSLHAVVAGWSTPGAALLIASLPHVPYPEAIGAFIVSAALIAIVGLTGWFDALMRRVPARIASALLAGILFEIGIEIFHAAQYQTTLV